MQSQGKEEPPCGQNLAIAPGGTLLFAITLVSYAFWLLHSFAIRNSFSAVRAFLLKSGLKP
jgi:hypothetical protein